MDRQAGRTSRARSATPTLTLPFAHKWALSSSTGTSLGNELTCFARAAPTSSASLVHPPAAGIKPSLVSGNQKRAEGPAILTSQASAHSNPPPTAAPGGGWSHTSREWRCAIGDVGREWHGGAAESAEHPCTGGGLIFRAFLVASG